MRTPSGWLLLLLLGLGLAACGADSQNNQSRQPLRLTLRLEPGYIDEPYNATLTADGGVRPYRFSLEGTLPKGLSYSNGRISGVPQEKGSFELIVSVEDANLSSRSQKATLTIGETPPPRLDQVFPLAEVADPFPYLFRVRNREARGFQAQIPLKNLTFNLESFKADSALLYVLRYDQERGLLDIDAVFLSPRKDVEAFRFTATPLPEQKVRPELSFRETRVAFYDRNGKLALGAPAIPRTPSEGRYRYSDLEALARNWGRRLSPAQPSPSQGQAEEEKDPSENKAPSNPNQAPPAQGLEGDLNGDGVVDQKDLELLRSSYAWVSVNTNATPPPPPAAPGPSDTPPSNPENPEDAQAP
ncbi:putative Ig domain-containing protein [Meiothermus rufus]|uniref:putative Ig domain-containing protein n=1 Tax=Meiothermus rufus TaxID=604332 RepID=UPI000407EE32|nr:putative Ig domain-containing protein [Meiothermus rufus]